MLFEGGVPTDVDKEYERTSVSRAYIKQLEYKITVYEAYVLSLKESGINVPPALLPEDTICIT